jgi:hypothetical protein
MIVHSLLQQLSDDGFGTVGEDLQVGILPLDNTTERKPRNGIAVTPRGLPVTRLMVELQAVDLYVRNTNPLTALNKAQELLEYLRDSYSEVCDLPPLAGVTTETFSNVTITPSSSSEYVGVDDNGGTTFVVSGEIQYEKVIN